MFTSKTIIHFVILLSILGCNKKSSDSSPVTTLVPPPVVLSSNADLSGLSLSAGTLSPAFSASVTSYTVALPFRNSSFTITPTASHASAVVSGSTGSQALSVGSNALTLTVTAQDGTASKVYSVTATRHRQYIYVTNVNIGVGADSVSQFSVNPTSGVLEPLSTPTVTVGGDPFDLAIDPLGKHFYVNNSSSNTMSQLAIDFTTGLMSPLAPATTVQGTEPFNIAFHPGGVFGYSVNGGTAGTPSIAIHTRDPSSGLMNATSTTSGGLKPWFIAVEPLGRYAYMTNFGVNGTTFDTILQFSINQTNGDLTPLATASIATQDRPWYLIIDPQGEYAYAANNGSSSVSMYKITQSDGQLVSLGTIGAGTNPVGLAMDPDGRFLYVGNQGSDNVSAYRIISDGTVSDGTLVSAGTVAAGDGAFGMKVDKTGNFLYVANSNTNTVSMFRIDQTTGALTALTPTATVTVGTGPRFIDGAF
ncbi:MAG TPA: beta-propeller fold lactonase family protein [Bacteriovoracaceae bacterium]|nr:beta-propeller fold lactonase family protein [Bacteriovoracaceae bacterium]